MNMRGEGGRQGRLMWMVVVPGGGSMLTCRVCGLAICPLAGRAPSFPLAKAGRGA
jgi:hypothetical protein